MTKKKVGKIPDRDYICSGCAKQLGGTWSRDHIATFYHGTCLACKEFKALANVGDWDWPDDKPRGMRD